MTNVKGFGMVRVVKTLTLVLALGVLLAAPATALPNERPATDSTLWNAIHVADAFWAHAGYPAHCDAQLLIYDDPSEPDTLARAMPGGCHVWVQAKTLRQFNQVVRHPEWASWLQRRRAYRDLCKMMVHERGHNLGFEHAHDGSVMEEVVDRAGVPGACVDWSVRSVPKRKAVSP